MRRSTVSPPPDGERRRASRRTPAAPSPAGGSVRLSARAAVRPSRRSGRSPSAGPRSRARPWPAGWQERDRNCGQRRASSVTTASGRLWSRGLSGSAMPAVVASAKTVTASAIVVRRDPGGASGDRAARSRTFRLRLLARSSSEIPAAARTISAKRPVRDAALPTAGQRPRRTVSVRTPRACRSATPRVPAGSSRCPAGP